MQKRLCKTNLSVDSSVLFACRIALKRATRLKQLFYSIAKFEILHSLSSKSVERNCLNCSLLFESHSAILAMVTLVLIIVESPLQKKRDPHNPLPADLGRARNAHLVALITNRLVPPHLTRVFQICQRSFGGEIT